MSNGTTATPAIPRALETYPSAADSDLAADLALRVQLEPFNALATGIFLLAIVHTFAAARFTRSRTACSTTTTGGARTRPTGVAQPARRGAPLPRRSRGGLRPVGGACSWSPSRAYAGWDAAEHYFNDTVNYTEPLFVVVIMALASTRPVIGLRRGGRCGAWRLGGGHAGRVVGRDPDRSARCSARSSPSRRR